MTEARRAVWRGEVVTAFVLGTIALVVRLVVVIATPASIPIYDMAEYWDRAVYIAEHGRLYENSWRMPAYPLALALVFRLSGSGSSIEAAHVFNAVAGAATVVLTYWLARRTAARRASIAAALAIAFYPSFVIYTTFIATEALVAVPVLATLIASTYVSRGAAVAAGLSSGVTALVRPAGVALLPALVFAFARSPQLNRVRRVSVLRPLLVLAAFALVMTPWWLHSARLYGRFVPLDTTGGYNLAIGNNPHASGRFRWREVGQMLADNLPGVDVTTPAGADRSAAVGIRHIRTHPADVVRLAPAKLAALFALEGREHAYLYSFSYFGPRAATTVRLWGLAVALAFPPLAVAALAGLAVRGGVSHNVLVPALLFIASSMAMHVMSFGDPRFHLPMVPVLAVLATGLARARNGFNPVRLALGLVVVVMLAVVWWTQFATYWAALSKLAAPGGWNSQLSYDDLL